MLTAILKAMQMDFKPATTQCIQFVVDVDHPAVIGRKWNVQGNDVNMLFHVRFLSFATP